MEVAQGGHPAAERVDRHPDLRRAGAVHELARRRAGEAPPQQGHLVALPHLRQVARMSSRTSVLDAPRPPAPAEPAVASEEGLRIAAVAPQRLEVGRVAGRRGGG